METHALSLKDQDAYMVSVLIVRIVLQDTTREMEDVIDKYLIVMIILVLGIVLNAS